MARFSYENFDGVEAALARQMLTRRDIEEIVTAGGDAAANAMKTLTEMHGHVRTGSMRDSIAAQDYRVQRPVLRGFALQEGAVEDVDCR